MNDEAPLEAMSAPRAIAAALDTDVPPCFFQAFSMLFRQDGDRFMPIWNAPEQPSAVDLAHLRQYWILHRPCSRDFLDEISESGPSVTTMTPGSALVGADESDEDDEINLALTFQPDSNFDWCRRVLAAVVIAWNVTSDGQLCPVSREWIDRLPEDVLNPLALRIIGTPAALCYPSPQI